MELKTLIFCLVFIMASGSSFAQTLIRFNGLLINKSDSTPVTFAGIRLAEDQKQTMSDDKGRFSFLIAPGSKTLHFDIAYIACHQSVVCNLTTSSVEKVIINCPPVGMKEVVIEGLTAKQIVEKAVAAIPANYMDSGYFAHSFYRQYKKVNGQYRNLIENQAVIMFKLSTEKKMLHSQEAIASINMRRSNYYRVDRFDENDFPDFMVNNPVYYLDAGALHPNALNFYDFSFDSVPDHVNYVIKYKSSDFSSENHGVGNYETVTGEAFETGTFTINKKSFAVVRTERHAFRNNGYNYPKNNNFVLPDRNFTQEFVSGTLITEYKQFNGKYYMVKLLHAYTNNFFRTQTYKKTYAITDFFEWQCDSVSTSVSDDLHATFYLNPAMHRCAYTYRPADWLKELPKFYFATKESVYNDLEKDGPLEKQFSSNGK